MLKFVHVFVDSRDTKNGLKFVSGRYECCKMERKMCCNVGNSVRRIGDMTCYKILLSYIEILYNFHQNQSNKWL